MFIEKTNGIRAVQDLSAIRRQPCSGNVINTNLPNWDSLIIRDAPSANECWVEIVRPKDIPEKHRCP